MNHPTIVTADDHPLLLKGLNDFLTEKEFKIVGSGSNGREAYNTITQLRPDIAILDIQMPYLTGLEVAKLCKSNNLSTKIILITLHKEREFYTKAQELNISGYILKEFALDEIQTCIQTVAAGGSYFSPTLMEFIAAPAVPDERLASLTNSEKKILKLIALDNTTIEIGMMLSISPRTVEKHRSNIIEKLLLEPKTNSLLIWAKDNQDILH